MKLKLIFSALLLSSLCAQHASAISGGVDGGGGKSVVCRDTSGKITSAETLDLYEGRVEYGYSIPEVQTAMADQAKQASNRIAAGRGANFQSTLEFYVNYVKLTMRLLPEGAALQPIDDAANVIIPKSCQLEQLANFTSQNEILVNGEIWQALSETNKAALLVHEGLYRLMREYGATTSLRTRKAVAAGFSGMETTDIEAGIPALKYECMTLPNDNGAPFPATHFYAFNDSRGDLNFQFDYIDGQLILSKTVMNVDRIPAGSLLTGGVPETFYNLTAFSSIDQAMPIVVSFGPAPASSQPQVMRIGMGSTPTTNTKQFVCGLRK